MNRTQRLRRADISKMERGLREPTLTEIFRIAHALGIKPETLVRRTRLELERKQKAKGRKKRGTKR
jgi:transcriptional regulator with XRE-family HTH domain